MSEAEGTLRYLTIKLAFNLSNETSALVGYFVGSALVSKSIGFGSPRVQGAPLLTLGRKASHYSLKHVE